MGQLSYLNENGEWKTRPVTEEDIRLYNRDCLISSIRSSLMRYIVDDDVNSRNRIDFLRPIARKMCYNKSEDLGLLYDTAIHFCDNSLSVLFSNKVIELITEKCLESNRDDLVEQYQDVRREITLSINDEKTAFENYIKHIVDITGLQDDNNISLLANSLGRFPLFYSFNRLLDNIEPKLSDVAKGKLCIYEYNAPLSEEMIQDVSLFYSKIKYRIDAFCRKIQSELEPLNTYRDTSIDIINRAERTSFSNSFHHYVCFRLIPNTHYYGFLKSRIPDWVFTPIGREIFYATPEYAVGIKRVLDEALSIEPSQAFICDKGDIRYCFDKNRYDLVFGDTGMYSLSGLHRLSKEERVERFRNTSSEHVFIPQSVLDECNRMLSKLNTGKRILNYVLGPDNHSE